MSNVAILWRKPTDTATYGLGSWVPSLPLANLTDPDTTKVARSIGITAGATFFRVDLGANARREPFDSFFLVGVVVTDSATDSTARAYSSGMLPAWLPTAGWGALPWGAFPWDGIETDGYPAGPTWIHRAPAPAYGRYLFVYIEETVGTPGYVQAGRFIAGAAWQPTINVDWNPSLRWVDPSPMERTRGGRLIVERRPKWRRFEMTFGNLTQDEAMSVGFEIDRQIGKGGNFMLSLDPDAKPNALFRQTIYATLVDTAPLAIPYLDTWTWRVVAEELI